MAVFKHQHGDRMKHLPATKWDAGWLRPVPTCGQPPASPRAPPSPSTSKTPKKQHQSPVCGTWGHIHPSRFKGKKNRQPKFAVEPCCRFGEGDRYSLELLLATANAGYRKPPMSLT